MEQRRPRLRREAPPVRRRPAAPAPQPVVWRRWWWGSRRAEAEPVQTPTVSVGPGTHQDNRAGRRSQDLSSRASQRLSWRRRSRVRAHDDQAGLHLLGGTEDRCGRLAGASIDGGAADRAGSSPSCSRSSIGGSLRSATWMSRSIALDLSEDLATGSAPRACSEPSRGTRMVGSLTGSPPQAGAPVGELQPEA